MEEGNGEGREEVDSGEKVGEVVSCQTHVCLVVSRVEILELMIT